MKSLTEIPLAEWLKIIAVLIAAFGLFFNAWQQRRANTQKRTEHVSNVLWRIYDDKELSNIYYSIEYQKFEYSSTFHGSDDEKKLDKLISIFDVLAKQYYLGLVTSKDIDLVSYEFLVIYQNNEVNNYFKFLDGWFERRGMKNPPFGKFRKLGKVIENEHFRR
ncbi:MAG TPA: hypothetical protein ENK73_06655 [Thiomicrospira sp.]|nr:hypothetical protein [Thiomicrospira sp.]